MSPETIFPIPAMRRIQRLHFIGIGGSGMNGIAEVLINLSYQISGSDLVDSPVVDRLRQQGAKVYIGHAASQVHNVDVVVVSTAINKDNVEYQAAIKLGLPIVSRATMLAELMRFRHGIAIAGTHGKTTTTSIVATIFAAAGYDPTYVIGGLLSQAGNSAKLGKSRYFIVEADESDASFLQLQPMASIITNIDLDHMETYGGDEQKLEASFIQFTQNLPFYGLAVCCIDDARVRKCIPHFRRPVITYGFSDDASMRCVQWHQKGLTSHVRLQRPDADDLSFTLNIPGKHNVLNAIAAVTIASEEGINDDVICGALAEFQGVNRRFTTTQYLHIQSLDEPVATKHFTLVDDYGHHPQEIAAVIDASRAAWPSKRHVMVFQPHRYTRTRDLFEDFIRVLSQVDQIIILQEYTAGEQPIPKADSKTICSSLRSYGKEPLFAKSYEDIKTILQSIVLEDDVVLMQGAGDIGRYAAAVRLDFAP